MYLLVKNWNAIVLCAASEPQPQNRIEWKSNQPTATQLCFCLFLFVCCLIVCVSTVHECIRRNVAYNNYYILLLEWNSARCALAIYCDCIDTSDYQRIAFRLLFWGSAFNEMNPMHRMRERPLIYVCVCPSSLSSIRACCEYTSAKCFVPGPIKWFNSWSFDRTVPTVLAMHRHSHTHTHTRVRFTKQL